MSEGTPRDVCPKLARKNDEKKWANENARNTARVIWAFSWALLTFLKRKDFFPQTSQAPSSVYFAALGGSIQGSGPAQLLKQLGVELRFHLVGIVCTYVGPREAVRGARSAAERGTGLGLQRGAHVEHRQLLERYVLLAKRN